MRILKKAFAFAIAALLMLAVGCAPTDDIGDVQLPDSSDTAQTENQKSVAVKPAVIDGEILSLSAGKIDLLLGDSFDPAAYAEVAEGYTLEVKGTELFLADGAAAAIGNFQLEYSAVKDGSTAAYRYCIVSVTDPDETVVKDSSFTSSSLWQAEGNVAFGGGVTLSDGGSVTQTRLSLVSGNYSLQVVTDGAVTVDIITDSFAIHKEFSSSGSSLFHVSEATDSAVIVITASENAKVSRASIDRANLTGDSTPPVIYGLVDRLITPDMEVDLLKDVSAVDDISGYVTSTITVSVPEGVTYDSGKAAFEGEGEYTVTYTAHDDEYNTVTASRTIHVANSFPQGLKLLADDFEYSQLANVYYDAYGASCVVGIFEEADGNHCLALTVESIPTDSHQPFPRLIFGNLVNFVYDHTLILEEGCEYALSYRIKIDQSGKTYRYQADIGEVLEADPWVTYFTAGIYEPGSYWGYGDRYATDEWTAVTETFKMEYDTNSMASIIMGFGSGATGGVNGGTAELPVTVYIDDIILEKLS